MLKFQIEQRLKQLNRAKWVGSTPIPYSWDVPEGMAYCRAIVDRLNTQSLSKVDFQHL